MTTMTTLYCCSMQARMKKTSLRTTRFSPTMTMTTMMLMALGDRLDAFVVEVPRAIPSLRHPRLQL